MGLRMRLARKRAVVSTRRPTRVERRAATLIELLVVISMIGFLITLLLPSLKRSMALAHSTVCMSNLREIGQSLMAYRLENDGWLPSVDIPDPGQVQALEDRDPWFVKLFPTYLNDPLILTCPADPYKFRMLKLGPRMESPDLPDSSSYGINSFIMTAGSGFIAEADRQKPTRPHETILLADLGPDDGDEGTVRQTSPRVVRFVRGPSRNAGLLAWDDGFDPFKQRRARPWLTQRHNRGINVLTVAGGVRSANTSEVMKKPMGRYYTVGAAGDCTFCNVFRVPHYSFAKDRLFWWVGPAPRR